MEEMNSLMDRIKKRLGQWIGVSFLVFCLFYHLPIGLASELGVKKPLTEFFQDNWFNRSNSKILSESQERITLIYFWDSASLQSLREMPAFIKLAKLYQPYGLQVFFAHAPEFPFSMSSDYVEKISKNLGIEDQVILDNQFKLWDKYDVKSWPTKVLLDSEGRLSSKWAGEGRMYETESQIQKLISQINSGAVLPVIRSPNVSFSDKDMDPVVCLLSTPEFPLSFSRAPEWIEKASKVPGLFPEQNVLYQDNGSRTDIGFFANGHWKNSYDYFEHSQTSATANDYIGLMVLARDAYAVLENISENKTPSKIYVLRDERPIPEALRGRDIQSDEKGTYIAVDSPRLYHLIKNEELAFHELRLLVGNNGIRIYSFSFSSWCEPEQLSFKD